MKALVLEQQDGKTQASVQNISSSQLPAEDVTVDIKWSSINYKDALAITGKGKIIRQFPMVPGIDFAGIVSASADPRFHVGQNVLLTGWGVGETHWGGLAEQAHVNGDWLVPLPQGLEARNAMIIGTAGLTAMLCVMALEEGGVTPESGEVLVTGASGGVGSTAVALLHQLGYQVAAVSGRQQNAEYLLSLGAKYVIERNSFSDAAKPLEKQSWAGVVDVVGGDLLAKVIAQTNYGGTVAACGLAGGYQLPTTVMPFILRNVRLQGVDSVMIPTERRVAAWQRLTELLPERFYQLATSEITLEQAPQIAADLLNGKVTGRVLVNLR
ncbi:MAG: oxidoreductase [Enterobacteriaceae bacterium]|nr:oxidoreductase [Enterobacteriaceae bacterium]